MIATGTPFVKGKVTLGMLRPCYHACQATATLLACVGAPACVVVVYEGLLPTAGSQGSQGLFAPHSMRVWEPLWVVGGCQHILCTLPPLWAKVGPADGTLCRYIW
jgi:hypothetical protein